MNGVLILGKEKKTKILKRAFSDVISGIQEMNRRKIEHVTHNVHPTCGYIAKKVTNIGDTIANAHDSVTQGLSRRFKQEERFYKIGDHLYAQRYFYTHHAIYIGNGMVIHYLMDKGIEKTTLENFSCGAKIFVRNKKESPMHYNPTEAVKRAFSRIGENKYNVATNNCDSFVRWCRNGV